MKTPLLCLHGALGTKRQFEKLKPLLGDTYEIYAFDFEGHGESISERPFSMQLFSENIIAFLDKRALKKVQVFGYSMGGYAALHTALKAPDRIAKIVTLGTKFKWDAASAEKEIRMLQPEIIEQKVPRFAAKLQADHSLQDWKRIVRKTANMMRTLSEKEQLMPGDFAQIQQEVVIGIGGADHMVSVEESAAVVQYLPKGKLKVIEGFVHPIEKIDAVELAGFLRASVG